MRSVARWHEDIGGIIFMTRPTGSVCECAGYGYARYACLICSLVCVGVRKLFRVVPATHHYRADDGAGNRATKLDYLLPRLLEQYVSRQP